MLILGGDRSQIHCWNIFQQRSSSIGKASLEGLLCRIKVRIRKDVPFSAYMHTHTSDHLFRYERCSGHQGLEGKKQEPGRLRGMRTPVIFAVISRRGQEGEICRLSPTCSSPRQSVKDCRSVMTKRTSEDEKTCISGRDKEDHLIEDHLIELTE